MSKITDEQITNYLIQDDVSRFIATLCRAGTTTETVIAEVGRKQARKGYSYDDDNIRSSTSSRLQSMEKLGILVYENNAWKTTEKVRDILGKYFGIV